MQTIQLAVKNDFLKTITSANNPAAAISELIWNSLDADATDVKVYFKQNNLNVLDEIIIQDNGHGIDYEEASKVFGNLGGSWKSSTKKSKGEKRQLHGEAGKGRFLAYALGNDVIWETVYKVNGKFEEFKITGTKENLNTFYIHESTESNKTKTGTTIKIKNIFRNFRLSDETSFNYISSTFANYLKTYTRVKLIYNGEKVEPHLVIDRETNLNSLQLELDNGEKIDVDITITEWKIPVERLIHICDLNGFTLDTIPAGIKAKGYQFTVFLKSDYFRKLDLDGLLSIPELLPDLQFVLNEAKKEIRKYFRKRESEDAIDLVEEWKKQDIYPYLGEAKGIIEVTEREVFDVCASNLHQYLPNFDDLDIKSKKLTFRLLKQSLDSPSSLRTILQDVLDLPDEQRDELAKILKKTTLTKIINSAKIVADRLDFLSSIKILLFEKESKETLLERKELHKILENETWIFGEEFNLTTSDESLTNVLIKHKSLLNEHIDDESNPVLREDGSNGIIDLMLSRLVPQTKPSKREHLIVELKRPNQKINLTITQQIQSYALAVAKDERFIHTDTTWIFWVLSNDITEEARIFSKQKDRPPGLLYIGENNQLSIWVKTWSEIIENCRARMQFFQKNLEYATDRDSGLEYLRNIHNKYLPKCLKDEGKSE